MEKRFVSRKRSRGMENVYDIRVEYLPKTSFVEKFGDFLERRNSCEESTKKDEESENRNNNILTSTIFDLENLSVNSTTTSKKLWENSNACGLSTELSKKADFPPKMIKSEKKACKNYHGSLVPAGSNGAQTVEELWRSRSRKIEDTRHLLQNLEKLVEKHQKENKKRATTLDRENNNSKNHMDKKHDNVSCHDPPTIHDEKDESNRSHRFYIPLKSDLIKRSVTLNAFDMPANFSEFMSPKRPGIKHCQSLGTQTDPRLNRPLMSSTSGVTHSSPLIMHKRQNSSSSRQSSRFLDEESFKKVNGRLVQEKETPKSVVGAKLRRLIWKISGRKTRSADLCHVHQKSSTRDPKGARSTQSTLDYGQVVVNGGRHHHYQQEQQRHLVKRFANDSYEYYLDKGTKMMFHKNGDVCEQEPKKGSPRVVELYEIRSAPNSLGRKTKRTGKAAETCSLGQETAILKNESIQTSGKTWPCDSTDILRRQNLFTHNRPRSMPVLLTSVKTAVDDFDSSAAVRPVADDFYWSNLDEKSRASYQKMTRANYKRMTSLCYDLLATLPPMDINEDVNNRRRICSSRWDNFSICSNGPIIVTDSTVLYLGKLDHDNASPPDDEAHQERVLFMITRLFSNIKFYDSDDNEKLQLPFKPPSLIVFTEYLPLSMVCLNLKEDTASKTTNEVSLASPNPENLVKTALCRIHVLPYCLTITLAQFIDDFAESRIYRSNEQKFRSIVQFLMIQLINILVYLTNEQIFALPKKFDDFFVQVRTEKSLPHLFLNLDLSKLKICKFSLDQQNGTDFVPLNRCCLIILRALLKSDRRFLPVFFEKMPNKEKILEEFRQKYDPHFLKALTNVVEILNSKQNCLMEVKSIFEIVHFAYPTVSYDVKRLCDDFFVKLWLDEQRARFLDFSYKFSANFHNMAPETDLAEKIYKRSFLLNSTVREITEICSRMIKN